jgi:hypothetical protein
MAKWNDKEKAVALAYAKATERTRTFRGGKGEETNARTPPGHRPLSSLTLS